MVLILKNLKKLKNNQQAGVATYVLIMFGMIFIMYLFGFTSMWNSYELASDNETLLAEYKEHDTGVNIVSMIVDAVTDTDNWKFIGGGIFAVAIGLIVGKFTGTTGPILTFILPILLLLVLNIFIFPLSGLSGDVGFMDGAGVPLTMFLFAFFNLFYVLAVIEFIRGNI